MLWLTVVALLGGEPVDRQAAERVMTETPPAELIAIGQEAVEGLGPYRYKMVKQERVNGELKPAQEIEMFVREAPFAVRMHFLGGPGKGRRLLYNPSDRADQFRVREAGLLSILGAIWIAVDAAVAKEDSNHSVKEAGMRSLLNRFAADLKKADGQGGMVVKQEGWDARGRWCAFYAAPNGGRDFDNAATRICTDVESRLPGKIEGFDAAGRVTERYEFSEVRSAVNPPKFFDSAEF